MEPDFPGTGDEFSSQEDSPSPRASSFGTVDQSSTPDSNAGPAGIPKTGARAAGQPEPPGSTRESVLSRIRRTAGGGMGLQGSPLNDKDLSRYGGAREIARGGMGAILEVFDRDIRRPIAMKMALWRSEADKLDRFIEEAQVTGQLEHPNIIPVHEIGADDRGRVYFTMKLVRGESLQRIIDCISERDPGTKARYGLASLLHVFLKVCDAVAFAHSRGIVHRDLKPENVMVGRFGEVQVMDWGLAKIRGKADSAKGDLVATVRSDSSALKTMDGEVMGTPSFMPPEQAAGEIEEIDERSDIWALGAILYSLLCHDAPYSGDTVEQVLFKAVSGAVRPPGKRAPWLRIPPELDAICMKCLEHQKALRYQSVEDLSADVAAFLDRRLVKAYRYGLFERVTRWVQRHPTASVGGGVGSVLLAVGTGLTLLLMQQANISELRAREAEQRTAVAQEHAQSATMVAKKAEERADTAMTLLEKGRRVAIALRSARMDLAHVFRDLEAAYFSGKTPEERSAILQRHSADLASFEGRLHDDCATLAAWIAMQGWLHHLAGDGRAALDLFDKATAEDADVAYGWLFRAMVAASEFLEIQPMPKFEVIQGQVVITEIPEETPRIGEARERFARALEQVRSAGVFGEASAEEFADLVAGLGAFHGKDPESADAALTRALAIPETAWLEVDLLFARAKVRHILGRYEAEERDLDSILARFPSHPRARFSKARIRLEEARILMDRRQDSRPKYLAALEVFSALVKENPENRPARANRAMINLLLGRIHNHRRMPWEENFEMCFGDFDALVAGSPGNTENLAARAWAHKEHGMILKMHGRDSSGAFEKAVADYDQAIAMDPGNGTTMFNRCDTFLQLAHIAISGNEDPMKWFDRAAADCETVEGIPSFRGAALSMNADLVLAEASWRNSRGEDAIPLLEKAVAILARLTGASRRHPMNLAKLGSVRVFLGDLMIRRGIDALLVLEAAEADLSETVQKDPLNTQAHSALGRVMVLTAEQWAKQSRGAEAIEKAREGISHMDFAVQKSPGYAHFRLERASSLLSTIEMVFAEGGDPSDLVDKILEDYSVLQERAPQYTHVKLLKTRALLLDAAFSARALGKLEEGDPARGELEQRALKRLALAVEAGIAPKALRDMPEFESLRGNPGFDAIAGKREGE